ncbi:MAG: PDZ domain-containing protein [Planctomycetales bacterium]|nr:PDZ domain-containing protein [Planctomycetales bacterium]
MSELAPQTPTAGTSNVVAFRDAQWKSRWVVVGLAFLLLWRSTSFIDPEWLARFPTWLLLILTGLAPQVFLLIFPIFTRDPNRRSTFHRPSASKCLVELGVAVPIVIGAITLLATANYLLQRMSPGSSLTPDALSDMVKSPNHAAVYLALLFACTFAPVAEEIFFRGFLYNAFRARMPVVVAVAAESVIFGFSHFFGAAHGVAASIAGLLLTGVYAWRRTLITPIFVHVGINFVASLSAAMLMFAHANSGVIGVYFESTDDSCVIRQVIQGSAAEEAGLEPGDIITSFDNEPIRGFRHLSQELLMHPPGDAVPVTVDRSGTSLTVTVVLQRRAPPPAAKP